MTKKELIRAVAADLNMVQTETATFIETFLDCIRGEMKAGNQVRLDGFGTFTPKTLAARKGETLLAKYSVPERQTVKFKPVAAFKKMLND